MNLFKTLILCSFCLLTTLSFAQKKTIKKANGFFKLNQYQDAIALYESALAEKENLSVRTKLAYCYRMTNQTEKAENQYSQIVQHDKAKSITYFYYAESLMSNGKYDLAKNWFLKFNEKEPDDENAVRMAYACDKVKTLVPYFNNVQVKSFEHNSSVDDGSAVFFNDGIVFTSDRPSGLNPLKQKSGWTGRDYQRIYFSKANSDGTYSKPGNYSKKLNDINKHCGPVSFTEDKKTVIFTRTGQELGKNNTYNIQLYSAESDDGIKWKKIKLLDFCNKENNYMHPAVTPDGQRLFFVSDKPGGIGGTDIYMSKKKGEKWGKPVNLGPIINTSAHEAFPFYHSSGKLFFSSKGHLSYGGFDVLLSNEKEGETWQKPVNIGKPINSSYDDIALFLNEDSKSGLFSSARDGGDDDIYLFSIMEGLNTQLDTIDFEGNGWKRNKVEVADAASVTTPTATLEKEVDQPISSVVDNVVVDDTPVKNIEGNIRNEQSLDEVRIEEDVKETPKMSEITSDISTDIKREEEVVVETPVVTEPTTTLSEPIVNEPSKFEEEKILEEEVIIEEVVDTPIPDQATAPVVEDVAVEPASLKTKPATASKKYPNLIIPAKKNTEMLTSNDIPDKEAEIDQQIIETPAPSVDVISDVEIETETETGISTSPIENDLKIEEAPGSLIVESENKAIEPSSDSVKTPILDREVIKPSAPTMMGADQSLASMEAGAVAELANLLRTNQNIPNKGFRVDNVNYSTGSTLLGPSGTNALMSVVDLMVLFPEINIEVGSHTSSLGNDVHNHNLSTNRAKSIKAFLVYKGIDANRILAKGYGETQLINKCSNGVDCAEREHEINERIEVKLIKD